jgi:diguanylate cyclase (GGDEF)-like protein
MKLSHKLALTAVLGGSALISLFLFKSFSQDYFIDRNKLGLDFKAIETAQEQLDNQILNNAFFLYANQDSINDGIKNVHKNLDIILNNPHIVHNHPKTYAALQKYRVQFNQKVNAIYDFQTTNIVIKNTIAALLASQQHLFEHEETTPQGQTVLYEINRLAGSILLAKNALDSELIASLHPKISLLERYHFLNPKNEERTQRMISHFKAIEQYFPQFVKATEQIKDPSLSATMNEAEAAFYSESDSELRFVSYFSYLLVALFIISIGLIAFFLLQSERDARIDPLTRLRNRKAYEEDLKQKGEKAALILININKFKHYNDFYGVKEGDRLLIETAHHIQNIPFTGHKPNYYRLGADDFGILFELFDDNDLYTISKTFLETFSEKPILIDNEPRTPSISISASRFSPLLETADMALKNKTHTNPTVYHHGLNLHQIIADNVTKARELKEALKENRVIPYFQPIISLSTRNVTKHEVLARIIMHDGQVRSIYPYLHIAKESNLYPLLTRAIVTQSFAIIAEHEGDFSINLSIDDIGNEETVTILEQLLKQYESIGKRIIFELLESEAIEEYNEIVAFIAKMRRYGCRIAIDDFGSGYSNFARILNLAIDIIKIDGSLIRNLDTDSKAVTIVQTIVNFTKSSSIKTIAEFVHNEAIADIVEKLEIDSAQGFYFYEPSNRPVAIG